MRRAPLFHRSAGKLLRGFLLAFVGCGSTHVPSEIKRPSPSGRVALQVDAPKGVELWRRDASGASVVCVAPCSAEVEAAGGSFEARVRDMPDSPTMTLPASEALVMKVETAPPVLLGLGVVTGTAGAMGMVIGGLLIGLDQAGNQDVAGTTVPAAITLAASSVVLSAGIVLTLISGTHVHVSEPARSAMRGVLTF
jgi:hypothetical protein